MQALRILADGCIYFVVDELAIASVSSHPECHPNCQPENQSNALT
jgi:hypothetical protein